MFVSVSVDGSEPTESSQDPPPEVPSAVDSTQWVAPPASGYSTAKYLLQNQGASSSDDTGTSFFLANTLQCIFGYCVCQIVVV